VNINEFSKIVAEIRDKRPIWFGLESDPPSTDLDIDEIEKALSIKLPDEYKQFIKMFGGGYFAFTIVYSGKEGSEWNIIMRNKDAGIIDSKAFMAVSENGVGDYYGFKVKDGKCESEITFYDHEDDNLKSTGYKDLFDYLIRIGLSPS
jgi:hypothetical protein